MSERRSSADLGPNLEAALSGFPFAERDWEKDATAVEAKLSQSQLGGTDSALLAAPLPSEPGEPSAAPSATATPLTHSGVRTQSLAEMARRSVENKQALNARWRVKVSRSPRSDRLPKKCSRCAKPSAISPRPSRRRAARAHRDQSQPRPSPP